jgi:hypothetical protein
LIPYEADNKTLSKWLDDTHNGSEIKNNGGEAEDNSDDDWAFFESSQTNKRKTQARRR